MCYLKRLCLVIIGLTLSSNLFLLTAAESVYVNARSNIESNPIKLTLKAGEYNLSIESGAWSPWSDGHGWITQVSAKTTVTGEAQTFGSAVYPTPEEALANSTSAILSLESDSSVIFFITDTPITDNIGGVTVLIEKLNITCDTPVGSEWDQATSSCQCPDNTVEQNGVCVCRDHDIPFDAIAEHHITLFAWTATEHDRSEECTLTQKGIKQVAKESCTEKYRCIKPTDECYMERSENVGSYVSPRDGVFHEDIAIDGVHHTLHYQSADIAVGAIAGGWSLSNHAVLKGQTVYMGNGKRYLVDALSTEGDNTVIPLGNIELVFDANNDHIATRDSYTKQTLYTFAYDTANKLVSITDRFDQTMQIIRDGSGVAEQIIAPHGQLTRLDVDENNDLLSVAYEDGASYTFTYETHLMTKEREPKGNEFLHIFDAKGKIVKVVDAEAGEWNFAQVSEETSGLNSILRASGDSVLYRNHYLNNGFLRSEKIEPNGDVIIKESTVDDSETRLSSCGVEKVYTYQKQNGILVKDPVEHRRIIAASSTTMPSGLAQVTEYDTAYSFEGDTLTKTLSTTESNGALATNERDYTLSTSVLTTPEGRKTTITYDEESLLPLTIQKGSLAALSYLYDSEGRVVESAQGNRVVRYTYDSRGNVATLHNVQRDTTTRYSYDERDRVTQIVYPDGHTTRFSYDANGNMSRLTTPTPADHDFAYNGVNKRASYTSPLGSATYYSYDKQRRVTQITRPSGKQISNTYTNGYLSRVTTPEGTTDYAYTCGNKPESITKGSESLGFTYDGDLLTRIRQSGILDQTIGYTYNNDFRVTGSTYAGATTDYSYDMDGLLTSSGDFTLLRDVNNSLVTEITDGSHKVKLGYNAFGEIKSQSSDAYDLQLRYDEGRVAHKTETLTRSVPNKKGKGAKKVKERSSYSYTYDDRDRLTGVYKDRALVEQYTYDANGNRASATVNGVTTTASYTLDDQLEVYGDNTYYYDEDGYLTEKTTPEGTTTYNYGTLGELKSVDTPTLSIEYLHNAANQRVAKKVNGVITEKYLWADLTTLLAIYDRNDNLLQRFEYADQRMPIAMTQDNQKYYLHYDQVGSLRAVSDVKGEIVKEVAYDTFGNIVLDSNPDFKMPFGFAGGLYDPDTKLTRFGYRDYDAYTGKWTAKDPIEFGGGDTNLYGYVLGDPVNFVDPLGLYDDPRLNGKGVPPALGGDGQGSGAGYGYGPFGGLCGAEGTAAATWVPDLFPESCGQHDICYADCTKTKLECDLALAEPYGWALRKPLSSASQEAYDNAQEHCKCK